MGRFQSAHTSRSTRALFVFLVMLCCFYILRDIVLLPVPEFIFVGIAAVAFVYLDVGHGLAFYVFTSVLVLPGNPIRLLYLVISMWKLNKLRKFHISIPLIGMLILQMVNMCVFSVESVGGLFYAYVEKMLYIVIPMLWISRAYDAEDAKRAALCFAYATLFAYGLYVIMTIQGKGIERLLSASFRLGFSSGTEATATMVSSYNANAIGTTSVLAISYLIALMERKEISVWRTMIMSAFLMLFAFLSRSRTSILMMAILLVALVGYYMHSTQEYRRGMTIIVVGALCVFTLYRMFPTVWNQILSRFQAEDITNGRSTINSEYLALWISDPYVTLFGCGIGNYVKYAYDRLSIINSAHNAFVDILMCWGITGLLLLLFFFIQLWRSSRVQRRAKLPITAYLPILLAFFAMQGGQYLTTGIPHIKLAMAILFVRTYNNGNVKIQNVKMEEVR